MMICKQIAAQQRSLVGGWILNICKTSNVQNPKVARHLVSLAGSSTIPPNDLTVGQELASELLKFEGSETSGELDISETFKIVNKSTCAAIASAILQLIESNIAGMDWIIMKLKSYSTVTQKGISFNQNCKVAPGLALEEALYSRAEAIVKVLSSFVLMDLKGMVFISETESNGSYFTLKTRIESLCKTVFNYFMGINVQILKLNIC